MTVRNKLRVGRNIAKARNARHISQFEVSRLVGRSQQLVAAWEKGGSLPSSIDLRSILRIYGVTVGEILRGETREAVERAEGEILVLEMAEMVHRMGDRQREAAMMVLTSLAG